MNEKDKNRDEITGKITGKDAGWLGSPWISPPQQEPLPSYMLPPPPPGGEIPQQQMGGIAMEAYGSGGSIDRTRRVDPYSEYGVRAVMRRAF